MGISGITMLIANATRAIPIAMRSPGPLLVAAVSGADYFGPTWDHNASVGL